MHKIIPDDELLSMACEFDLGPEPILLGRIDWEYEWPMDAKSHRVYVRNMGRPEESQPDRWAIFFQVETNLNKSGRLEMAGLPSSRTKSFYKRCRYDSVHEAIGYYLRWKEAILKWCRKEILKSEKSKHWSDRTKRVILNYGNCPAKLLKF